MTPSRDAMRSLLVSEHDSQRAQRAIRKLARRTQRRREARSSCADGLQEHEHERAERQELAR